MSLAKQNFHLGKNHILISMFVIFVSGHRMFMFVCLFAALPGQQSLLGSPGGIGGV